MGRPSLGLDHRLNLYLSREEKLAAARAARLDGTTVSDWVRRVINRASGMSERRVRQAARRAAND